MKEPKCPQKKPYVISCEIKKYAWCSCGKSSDQPFCDGSHKGTEFVPIIMDNEKEGNIAWCGCKKSKKGAFCDGTHSYLKV